MIVKLHELSGEVSRLQYVVIQGRYGGKPESLTYPEIFDVLFERARAEGRNHEGCV
ncbi:MAG: hypothetical protein PQJ59_09045 [Spirochaetales bacterium]|nr:hypothetical protein [Spirochaetales bacterium]